jgi:hypothetical protein
MTRVFAALVLACAGLGLAGCVPESGFVEIKRKVPLQRDDVLIVNKTTVVNLAQRDSAVVKQPTGNTTLTLKRGERQEKLCEFSVNKNRVTTVTLTVSNALVRCSAQS